VSRPAALLIDDIFLLHRADGQHPERPERLEAIAAALDEAGLLSRLPRVPSRPATAAEIERVHVPGYLGALQARIAGRSGYLDPDTFFCPRSLEAALHAAGGAIDLCASVMAGDVGSGAAFVRPPGHHAEPGRAMGFCLLNNVALAAAAARAGGAGRVAVLDWDLHHGNGTQAAFFGDPSVLYLSVHQFPYYPGTGDVDEIGEGQGRGFTINVPYPAGMGDAEYLAALDWVFLPALKAFRPDVILVSAGFDAHERDPLGGMRVTQAGFVAMARRLRLCAADLCAGRIVLVLEGGYDLFGLARSAVGTVLELAEARGALEAARDPNPRAIAVLDRVRAQLAPYWPALR
jgi:acetoin utilization deacetylase AcuC-like enzyme